MLTRTAAIGAGAAAVTGLTAACVTDSSPSPAVTGATTDVPDVNHFQDLEEALTIKPFNAVKRIPAQTYPADLLTESLEMQNLRERLLRFNRPDKLGVAYLFTTTGALVMTVPVKGKISSTQSQMTTDVGMYKRDDGSRWGTTTPVKLAGDDLSFGPNEGGDQGKFFFTPDDVYVFWDGPILYMDAPLKVNQPTTVLEYVNGSKPSSTAAKA
jgi:hypothetical protein